MYKEGLKDKTVKGVGWSAAESILRYGVSFVVGIILARLLTPDEYGIIGILTIFITVFEIIIDGGFINALIRKQDAKDIDYCTVFWTNLVVSIVMAGVLFMCSDLIARFFEREELRDLMRAMSSIVIINALALVQKARLTKALNFKTQTKVAIFAAVGSGLIGIFMAYRGFGVWALVAQQLSNAFFTTLFYWIVNRWIPRIAFSIESCKEMWNFGWKLMLSGIFNSISNQLQQVVIGKAFSTATLGQYTRAYQFGNLFSGNLTSVIQRVSFPVLSAIQDDTAHLKRAYKRVIKVTVFATFILMMMLAAISKPLICVLIGEKWTEAAYLLQIMCFSMMLYPLHALNLNAIQVMGRSDLTLRINIIKNLLIIFPVIAGIFLNIYWMLFVEVLRGYACYYLNAYYTKYVLDYSVAEQIKDILPSIKVSFSVSIPVYLLSFLSFSNLIILIIQILFGAMILYVVCEKNKYDEYVELKDLLANYLNKIIRKQS